MISELLVALHKLGDGDDAVLVSLDFFINVVSLDLGQNLNDSLLQASFGHKFLIVGSSKPLFLDLDRLDRSHSIPELIILPGHELSFVDRKLFNSGSRVLEHQDIAFLSELDLIKHLKADIPRIKVVVEVRNVLGSNPLEL